MTPSANPDTFVDPLSDYEPRQYKDELQRSLAEDMVTEITMSPCARLEHTATVRQAVERLRDDRVSCLVVIRGDQLVGIFSERDVLEQCAERFKKVAELPVTEVMTSDPIVVYDCDTVGAALAAITAGGYRHVPVLGNDGQLLGIVSPRRVFTFLATKFDS